MFALLFALPSFAQKNHGDKDKETRRKEFLEFKLNFLADELEIKDDQRKQFDEVYSQMEAERRVYFKKIKEAEKRISDNKKASEADYEKANREINDAKEEMARIERKYDDKFATFLSKKQMYRLREAENKFTEKVRNCRDKKKGEKKEKR